MRTVALKGLLGRKTRAILTGLAIVLGVAMISGTYVLTDTISKAFDQIFSGSYKNTAAVITGKKVVEFSNSGNATVSASLLERVRKLPDVEAASGQIFDLSSSSDYGKLIDRNGKVIGSSGNPTFAFGLDGSQPKLNPLTLESGRWPHGRGEIVIDAASAKGSHYSVGDRIRAAVQGPARWYGITGTAQIGGVDSLGGATFAVFDVPTAQKLLGKVGEYDAIAISAKHGVSPELLKGEIGGILPASAEVRTGSEQAEESAKDVKDFTKFIQYFLLAFGAIALFVGAFVIFNTLSITVAQRTREFATLRTLGASRRQVLRSVLLEGFVIGLLASVAGLFLGLALAKGLGSVMKALQLDLPQTGTVFASRTVIVSLVVGVVITLIATIVPAVRATRVPPISAVREGATLPPGRLAGYRPVISLATVGLAVALLAYGLFVHGVATGPRLASLGFGVLALFVGVALLSSKLVRPLARVVGWPSRRFGGGMGRLARENAMRNPGRTAATAAALMIGLALVTFVATFGASLRSSDRDALRQQVTADYVVTSKNGWDPFPVVAGNAVSSVPGVQTVSHVRNDQARVLGDEARVDGIGPELGRVYHYDWVSGSDATLGQLGRNGAVVRKKFADKHHLTVGSPVSVVDPAGGHLVYVVKGIFDQPKVSSLDPILGSVGISQAAFDATFPRPKDIYTFLNVKGGSSEAATAALERALAPYPDAKIRTRADWVEWRSKGIDKLLNLLYVLLALSVVVSLFGMVNTLVLSVFERTRELGMMRAVGVTRRQVRRLVRHESVITALIGASLGLPLGLFLAGITTRALSDQGIGFSVPVPMLVVFAVVAIVAGVLAAVMPARRAARLNVLSALQYE
jgi:putative ABC transport system permease protein